MNATEREIWVLNFYRNSELHGALLMGRLARSVSDTALLVHLTRHCATEARHAAMLSEAIAEMGGRIDPHIRTVQERYSAQGGVPTAFVDLLVLSEVLEGRVRDTYRSHVQRSDSHPVALRTLGSILQEMDQKHGAEHAGWLEQALDALPRDVVDAARRKWGAVDVAVVEELRSQVDARFTT